WDECRGRQPATDGVDRTHRGSLGIQLRVLTREVARVWRRGIHGVVLDLAPKYVERRVAPQIELVHLARRPAVPERRQRRIYVVEKGVVAGDVGIVGGIGRRQYAIEHRIRDLRQLRPVPIGNGEIGIAAQLADRALEPAEITAVPDEEPPIAVWAI